MNQPVMDYSSPSQPRTLRLGRPPSLSSAHDTARRPKLVAGDDVTATLPSGRRGRRQGRRS
jgi:hypothetical protein